MLKALLTNIRRCGKPKTFDYLFHWSFNLVHFHGYAFMLYCFHLEHEENQNYITNEGLNLFENNKRINKDEILYGLSTCLKPSLLCVSVHFINEWKTIRLKYSIVLCPQYIMKSNMWNMFFLALKKVTLKWFALTLESWIKYNKKEHRN